jgi:DNA invertase Pin-like site-specific DNA recombinase
VGPDSRPSARLNAANPWPLPAHRARLPTSPNFPWCMGGRGGSRQRTAERPQLEATLPYIRTVYALVVTKIDWLARSVASLVDIEYRLHTKGASLQVLDPSLDTGSSIGRLAFNMVAAIAQFEREIMLERQREGIAKAKAEGKCEG